MRRSTAVTRVEVGTGGRTARVRERPRRRFADWSMTALARLLVRVVLPQHRDRGRRAPPRLGTGGAGGQPHQRARRRPSPHGGTPPVPAVPGQIDLVQDPAPVAVPEARRRHPGAPGDRCVPPGPATSRPSPPATRCCGRVRVVAVFPEGISHDEVGPATAQDGSRPHRASRRPTRGGRRVS